MANIIINNVQETTALINSILLFKCKPIAHNTIPNTARNRETPADNNSIFIFK